MFTEAELIFIITVGGSSAVATGFWVAIKGKKPTYKESLPIVISKEIQITDDLNTENERRQTLKWKGTVRI